MKQNIEVNWIGNMAFETEINGHKITVDAAPEVGGENKGPRPKPLLMLALAGCTGMDVVSLLKKMRIEIDGFSIAVDGDITEEHPKHFSKMKLIYKFKGKNLPFDKIENAIKLSQDKYCGVNASFKKAMDIDFEIQISE